MKRTILLAGLLVGCAVRPSADVRVAAMVRVGERLAMAGTEVTRGDFARFAAATGRMPDGPCGFLADGPSNRWVADLDHSWQSPGFAQTDRHPVVCVDFADANAYAVWLNKRTGRRFRLPTATEWERAARAGTKGERWWGADLPCAYANVADRARARLDLAGVIDPATVFDCEDGHARTAPVGSYGANPWGLHDMLGNVWEWTLDCAEPGVAMDACASPIDRGGSWTNSPKYLSAAVRHPDLRGARTTVLGFRLVEDLPPR
ncbi:formylglycine-generating enzyme family protein [Sphingomonas sp.]|jgi:formylglycine-generating enzyme required for sulfatase activity|uniref:formylglycine-generating enzyme family protein n=1 Tax=Sphingomonas sp. TaxID=28214 RepID=UPI002EDA50F2